MRFGIVVFPGTWSDGDCFFAIRDVLGQEAEYIWHKDTNLAGCDCVILPGGFSYGDYLRPGAIARFAPVMGAVQKFADSGGIVLGICNGFQLLCEVGLLPGALLRNHHLQFRCQWVHLRVENPRAPFTSMCKAGDLLRVPISHGDGSYYADETTMTELFERGLVAFRYCADDGSVTQAANPNGSLQNVAGITSASGNVLGMMPHPERACEELLGSRDGRLVFDSLIHSLARAAG